MGQKTQEISRQQLARKEQGYDDNPQLKVCENCHYYRSEFVLSEWGRREEKRRRCSMGGFAVKRKSSCQAHVFKDTGKL